MDADTGKPRHSFFWRTFHFWGILFFAGAILVLVVKYAIPS